MKYKEACALPQKDSLTKYEALMNEKYGHGQ